MGTNHQAQSLTRNGSDVLVRALCSGKTSAFQADDAGSIPAARFSGFNSDEVAIESRIGSSLFFRWIGFEYFLDIDSACSEIEPFERGITLPIGLLKS